MTPSELKQAREALKFSHSQMARMLGYDAVKGAKKVRRMEKGARAISAAQARLVRAYLDGYRPADWPASHYEWHTSYEDIGGIDELREQIYSVFPHETPFGRRAGWVGKKS